MRQEGMNMNKLFKLVWLSAIPLTLLGCDAENGGKKEVIIFAAASMTESLNSIKKTFQSLDPNVELSINYAGSNTLATQINEGYKCDIFISANQKQMNNVSGEIIADSCIDVLENQVALVVSTSSSYNIQTFEELKTTIQSILDNPSYSGNFMIGLGQSEVPVRKYSDEILNNLLGDNAVERMKEKGIVREGQDVKQVTSYVAEGMVDVALIYKTDANSAGLTIRDLADDTLCSRSLYPFAILKNRSNANLTDLVFTYITKSEKAKSEYEKVGFTVL